MAECVSWSICSNAGESDVNVACGRRALGVTKSEEGEKVTTPIQSERCQKSNICAVRLFAGSDTAFARHNRLVEEVAKTLSWGGGGGQPQETFLKQDLWRRT